jgi:hypothetical protein
MRPLLATEQTIDEVTFMFSALKMFPMDIRHVLPSAVTVSRWMEKSADGCSNLTCTSHAVYTCLNQCWLLWSLLLSVLLLLLLPPLLLLLYSS